MRRTLRDWLRGERVESCWGWLGLAILAQRGLPYTLIVRANGVKDWYLTGAVPVFPYEEIR